MSSQLLHKHPDYTVCIYCNSNMKRKSISCSYTQYDCENHKPLLVQYDFSELNYSGKWSFSGLQISIPQHFGLHCNISNIKHNVFSLYEWKSHKFGGGWFKIDSISFNYCWVMEQSLDKLNSLLQMYKVFS